MGVRMTDEAAATIEDRFDNLSQDFWNLMEMTPTARADVEDGCGEFSSDMAAYTSTFESAWKQCFEVGSKTCGLIAGNTNEMHINLEAVDRDLSHTTDITLD